MGGTGERDKYKSLKTEKKEGDRSDGKRGRERSGKEGS
jgi:hypothetical protein